MADPFDTTSAPLTEPESILIGSFTAWRREITLSAATYSLKYRMIPTFGGAAIEIIGTTTDGLIWTFDALSSVTSAWRAGTYRWDLIVTRLSDSEVAITETGMLRVFATSEDRRTHAEVMVAKIESLLAGRADSDIDNYSIKNRSISKMPVKELIEWRDYYRSEVARTGGSTTGAGKPRITPSA
jgi:hypothetical protein